MFHSFSSIISFTWQADHCEQPLDIDQELEKALERFYDLDVEDDDAIVTVLSLV